MPPPLPARRRPKKKRRWLKVVLLVVGIPVAAVATLFSLGLMWEATAKSLPVGERDREVLITAAYAGAWIEDFTPAASGETLEKKRYLDGSHALEYEYEDPAGMLYIACTVTVEDSAGDAKVTYTAGDAGTTLGLDIADVDLVERDELFRYGASSRCALIRDEEGGYLGNYFTCRSGRRVFELVLMGLYFDEPAAFGSFLRPVLTRVDAYEP